MVLDQLKFLSGRLWNGGGWDKPAPKYSHKNRSWSVIDPHAQWPITASWYVALYSALCFFILVIWIVVPSSGKYSRMTKTTLRCKSANRTSHGKAAATKGLSILLHLQCGCTDRWLVAFWNLRTLACDGTKMLVVRQPCSGGTARLSKCGPNSCARRNDYLK